MRLSRLKLLERTVQEKDPYTLAFFEYLKDNRDVLKYISSKDVKVLIKNNLHFQPYLEELKLLMNMKIPQRYLTSILNLRSCFVDTTSLEFYDYLSSKTNDIAENLQIMAIVIQKAGYFHPSFSLESIIKVISVATIDEAVYIFSWLNNTADNPDIYSSFDEYIRSDINASQAYVFLDNYIRSCKRISSEKENVIPDVFLKNYIKGVYHE